MEPRNRNGRLPPLPGSPTLAEFHRTPTSCRASEHDLSRLRAPCFLFSRLVSLRLDVTSLSALSLPRTVERLTRVAHDFSILPFAFSNFEKSNFAEKIFEKLREPLLLLKEMNSRNIKMFEKYYSAEINWKLKKKRKSHKIERIIDKLIYSSKRRWYNRFPSENYRRA